jgi:hypothetical protein
LGFLPNEMGKTGRTAFKIAGPHHSSISMFD